MQIRVSLLKCKQNQKWMGLKMGFSQQFFILQQIPAQTWEQIVEDVKIIFANLPEYSVPSERYFGQQKIVLSGGYNFKLPHAGKDGIFFNGCAEIDTRVLIGTEWKSTIKSGDECECDDFYLENKKSSNWCKTNRCPYDCIVQMVMYILHYRAKKCVDLSSDAQWEDAKWCIHYAAKLLKYPAKSITDFKTIY